MKALVLVQSTRMETYVNVCAALCAKYPQVRSIRLLHLTDDRESVSKSEIREHLVYLAKQHEIYESAADVNRDDGQCTIDDLKKYLQGWDIVDVSGTSKEIAVTVAAISVSSNSVKVCLVNWFRNFKRGETWILTEENHEYIDLLSQNDLRLMRKDHMQKKHVITAFAGIFALLTIVVLVKMLFPSFFIPNVLVNIFGLLIGVAGLYLAAVSLKY